jgi:hypothetical protein
MTKKANRIFIQHLWRKSGLIGAAAAAVVLLVALLTMAGSGTISQAKDATGKFTADVAIDATTFRFVRQTAVLPTNVIRGDTFMVDGLIYPGGSIAPGNTPFPPTSDLPIGRWVCRGTFQTNTAGLVSGVTPHVYSSQYFLFNDGTAVVTDGPEGGSVFDRAIIGGWGGGATGGQSMETPIGANATGLFNLHFDFRSGRN